MQTDIKRLQQMYAILCGAADEALTLLENDQTLKAKEILRNALLSAEELYVAGE